ncbi:hypothetical protein SAMD00019534_082380 [Acytostelium subglobosum LB1]|uniref:hypothetical protein n=1 Tax=Acytostelium subglobosum LB1 TaxID=1410327 RepID=UPI000644C0A7|nr:hypothetical protein SAMD00019534_082380 [Acytostelium subglobosum LB1]GAM25063.1 hypothetical protein SAMD00019534_082380 [Acytostelium subglobosum LB1]|eukprot:XP_012752152.1 hypothetical protein SAMD00019534_082380 [Acytostelium subglobosum LB1]
MIMVIMFLGTLTSRVQGQQPTISNVLLGTSQILTIMGTNFAKDVNIYGIRYNSLFFSSSTYFTVKLQQPWLSSMVMQVNVTNQLSSPYTFATPFKYTYPDTVSPVNIPYSGGKITITGSFLGSASTPSTVLLANPLSGVNTTCSNINYIIDQTKIECTPASIDHEDILGVTVIQPGINQFANSISVSTKLFTVTNIDQDNDKILLTGLYFYLYYNLGFEVTIGSGSTNDITCISDTQCSFFIPINMTGNGSFTMKALNTQAQVQKPPPLYWDPVFRSLKFVEGVNSTLPDHLFLGTQMLDGVTSASVAINNLLVISSTGSVNPFDVILPKFVGTVVFNVSGYTGHYTTFNWTYPAPRINTTTIESIDNALTISIFGKYLNQDDVTDMAPTIGGIIPLSSIVPGNYTFLRTLLPKSARSGNLTVSIGGQHSSFKVTINPNVTRITSPPTPGGLITITGYYLSPLSFDNEVVLDIKIAGRQCHNPTMIGTSFDPYTITCVAPFGSGNKSVAIFNGNLGVAFPVVYQPPTIDTVTSTILGQSGTVTITGTNFANVNIFVTIGNTSCISPSVNPANTQIICLLKSRGSPVSPIRVASNNLAPIPNLNDTSLPVTVTIDGQSVTKSKFIYSASPVNCSNPCEHGTCVNGVCQCDLGYTGVNCTLKLDASTPVDVPQPSKNSTTIVLGSKAQDVAFDIIIAGIREISSTDEIIKYINMRDTVWNLINTTVDAANNTHNLYNSSLSGVVGFTIMAEMTVFATDQQYDFEGDVFQVSKNSIKYKITLSKWPFTGNNNYLQVLFQSTATSAVQNKPCDGSDQSNNVAGSSTSTNTQNSVRLMEIYQGAGVLRAFFSDRLLVDGRLTYSQVSQVNQSDPAFVDINNAATSNTSYVLAAISVPHFSDSAVVDPNYSSLLVVDNNKPPTGSCGGSSSNDRPWLIPVIVVASVIGAVIIVLSILMVIKRNRLRLMMASIRLKEMRR